MSKENLQNGRIGVHEGVAFEDFADILRVKGNIRKLAKMLRDIIVLATINFKEIRVTGVFSVVLSVFMPVGVVVFLSIAQPNMPTEMRLKWILGNVIISIVQTCIGNLGGRIAQIKWFGGAEYYFVLPIKRVSLMYGILINYLMLTIPGIIAVLTAGALCFKVSYHFHPVLLLLFLEMIIAFCGIGFLIGMKSRNVGQAAALSQAVSFFLMFLTPVYYSIYSLPPFYRWFAHLMPTTYGTQGICAVIMNNMGSTVWTDTLALGIFAVLSLIIINQATRWTED